MFLEKKLTTFNKDQKNVASKIEDRNWFSSDGCHPEPEILRIAFKRIRILRHDHIEPKHNKNNCNQRLLKEGKPYNEYTAASFMYMNLSLMGKYKPDSPTLLTLFLQSYMEDHLKNKDRLEKEWEALCAYQAEPNACTIGLKDGNAKKNRSAAVVACKQ